MRSALLFLLVLVPALSSADEKTPERLLADIGTAPLFGFSMGYEYKPLGAGRTLTPAGMDGGLADGHEFGVFFGQASIAVTTAAPEALRSFSIVTKLSTRSFTRKPWQALLNAEGWRQGDLHYQFQGNRLELSVNGNVPQDVYADVTFVDGEWYDIVTTYDADRKTVAFTVNGKPAGGARYTTALPVTMGSQRIGAWPPEDRWFQGYLSYLYVFRGALDGAALTRYYAPPTAAPASPPAPTPAPRPAPVAITASDTAELVFANTLDDQTGWGYYLGFIVTLEGLAQPLLIRPEGRFVRVRLPPGTYAVKGIGYWDLKAGEFLSYVGGVTGSVVLRAGERTLFPWILQSRLVLINAQTGSYRPEIWPVRAGAEELARLEAEYAAALRSGDTGLLPVVAAGSLFQSIDKPVTAGDLRLAQDDLPFSAYAARERLAYPASYTADGTEALLPQLTVDTAGRTVTARGYLPRTGVLAIFWGDETSSQIVNGRYEAAGLTHTFQSTAPIQRLIFEWSPRSGGQIRRELLVRFEPVPPRPTGRVERRLPDGSRLIVEDNLAQIITPNPRDVYESQRIGAQTLQDAVMSFFRDTFDFLYIAPTASPTDTATTLPLRNDAGGIAIPVFESAGVARRLRSVIRLTGTGSLVSGWSVMSHELAHAWGQAVIPTEVGGGHWGNTTAAGKLGGIEPDTLTETSPGVWRAHALNPYHGWWLPFGELELYLMGLAPAGEVRPVRVFSGLQVIEEQRKYVPDDYVVFRAAKVETVTIQDIIRANGPRTPAYGAAQTAFRALVVVLTDRELSPVEIQPLEESLAVFADTRPMTFGQGNTTMHNFAAATRGRGTLVVDGLLGLLRP